MNSKLRKKKKKINLVPPIVIAVLIVFGLWLWNYLTLFNIEKTERGTFGDMFGSVNAIFSGLAFAGIIITIYIQSHELKLQRKELKLTRKEMELTRDEFVSQNYTMKLQQFENTLFQMLSMFYENTDKLSYANTSNNYSGKLIFLVFYNNVNNRIRSEVEDILKIEYFNRGNHNTEVDKKIVELEKGEVLHCIMSVDDWYKESLYSYFSTLKTIMKLIEKTQVDDKMFYASILKSYLSISELIIIFYNCLLNQETSEFNKLVKEFLILENLNDEKLENQFLKTELKKYQQNLVID